VTGPRGEQRGRAAAYGLLGAPILLWGGSFRVAAVAGRHTSALMQNGLRVGISAVVLLALLPLLGARLPRGRLALWALATGLLGVVLFYEGFAEGTIRAGAGNAAVLSNSSPLFVLVLARLALRERMPAAGVLGLLLGFAGIVVMVSSQLRGGGTPSMALGMGLALAAAVGWAVATLVVKWLVDRDPELDVVGLTAGQFVVGALVLAPLAFAVDGTGGTAWSSGELWGAIAFLAGGASVAAYVLFFAALKRLAVTVASASQFLVPVVAVLVEIARGAVPGGLVLGGMGLALAGVALVNLAPFLRAPHAAGTPLAGARDL
jgi:drug/metabolite transporter (DMT)-like permease